MSYPLRISFRFICQALYFRSFVSLAALDTSERDKFGLALLKPLARSPHLRGHSPNKRRKCSPRPSLSPLSSFFFCARRGKLHIGKPSNPFATVLLLTRPARSNPPRRLASARILTRELCRRIERAAPFAIRSHARELVVRLPHRERAFSQAAAEGNGWQQRRQRRRRRRPANHRPPLVFQHFRSVRTSRDINPRKLSSILPQKYISTFILVFLFIR